MNFSLKPHPLIAHWIPGTIVVASAALAWNDWNVSTALALFAGDASRATISILALSVAAFVLGEIIDAFRDFREKDDVNWNFFFDASEEEIKRLNESYFTYYVLGRNLVWALLIALAFFIWHPPAWASWNTLSGDHPTWRTWSRFVLAVIAALGAAWILNKDSKGLRDEIKTHTKKTH